MSNILNYHLPSRFRINLGKYQNGNTSFTITDVDGDPLSTISINVDDSQIKLKKNEIILKVYSENAGISEMLIRKDLIRKTKKSVKIGRTSCPICTIHL